MYEFCEVYMGVICCVCPPPALELPEECVCSTLGPEAVTRVHINKNLATGWCAIMALGAYNYTKGGHMSCGT